MEKKGTRQADVVVVGGGASGLMCAVTAAGRGLRVVLLESNRQLGRKLRITGKGRCNLCNDCDIKTFMANVPGDARFLYSALSKLSPQDVMDFFRGQGLPLKTERGGRVFPVSDNANDVADVLARLCRDRGVELLQEQAVEIELRQGAVCAVRTEHGLIGCRAAVLCTGGLSYPLTGSRGAGHRMAEKLGHRITALRPSLVPLESDEVFCAQMQGLTLKNVGLSAYEDGRLIFREQGELLFTHFGLSGPLILSASAKMRHMGEADYRLAIDLKPGLDEKKLDARLLRDFEKFANRAFQNALGELLPKSMIPVVVERSQIPAELKVNSVSRQQRRDLLALLKGFDVHITGFRPMDEAIVTAGGVDTREVDPRSMQSKLVPGLYFAGELLDLDAYTGGFNLQIAWSTGYMAGISVCTGETET